MTVHSLQEHRRRIAPAVGDNSGVASPLLATPLCLHHRQIGHCWDCAEHGREIMRQPTVRELILAATSFFAVLSVLAGTLLLGMVIAGAGQ
jgi:hypothetical protein